MSTNGEISRSARDELHKVEVCCGGSCMTRGAEAVFDKLQHEYKDTPTVVQMCNCLGRCRKGPNVLVDEKTIFQYTKPRTVKDQIEKSSGIDFMRYGEENLDLENDYLGDL